MGSMELALIEKAVTVRAVSVTFLYGKRSHFHFVFLYSYTAVSMKKLLSSRQRIINSTLKNFPNK